MKLSDLRKLVNSYPYQDDPDIIICVPADRLKDVPDMYNINHFEKVHDTIFITAKKEILE